MPGVAEVLVSRLREAGTRAIFGLPGGGGNLDLIQAAGRAGLPFVLTATETGSAIAALAHFEVTGAPGACITTLGPGAASVVNGVACAKLDRASILVITDSYATGTVFEHQRLDHEALLAPVTKWSGTLRPGVASTNIDVAFDRLGQLPYGPVHLDCPADFEREIGDGGRRAWGRSYMLGFNDPEVFALLESARRPLLIAGLGARTQAVATEIRSACERARIPALVTYKAKGVVPDTHPWFAGVFTHGAIERPIIEQSDLLIGIGFDPVEILPRPWTYTQPILSIAGWELDERHVPFRAQHVGIETELVDRLGRVLTRSEWDQRSVREHVDAARRAIDLPAAEAGQLTAQDVVRITAAAFGARARVTVDAGAHMFPATMMWPVGAPGDMLISNGLSTMGFALPAAIGAAVVDRDRPVVALTGDGGLLICLGELATAARERLNIVIVVINDASLSLIEIKQQARQLAPQGVALGDVNWPRIAEGFGLPAWSAGTAGELEAALERALTADGPCLIEARIDRSNYGAMLKAIRG